MDYEPTEFRDEYNETVWRMLRRARELDHLLGSMSQPFRHDEVMQTVRRAEELYTMGMALDPERHPTRAEDGVLRYVRYILEGVPVLLSVASRHVDTQ